MFEQKSSGSDQESNHQEGVLSSIFSHTSTGIEALMGGAVAGYTGYLVNGLIDSYWGNFVITQTVPTFLGAGTFAVLGTALKYGLKFQEEKAQGSELTFKEFCDENKSEAARFFASIWAVGDAAFITYTSSSALAEIVDLLSTLPRELIAATMGFVVFAVGNRLPGLQLPITKLAEIAGVFAGFAIGHETIELIDNANIVNEEMLNTVVKPLLPAVTGFATAIATNLLTSAGGFFYNCANKQGNDEYTIQTADKTESKRLLV